MSQFNHLHCHTQYSLLDGQASVKAMVKKAVEDQMQAIAITDHGNMFGVFDFVNTANKTKTVKPIIGCEFYLVADRHRKSFTKTEKDKRYHQLFLAKNEQGYKNLSKLCSLGYMEGLYSKWPRIDKELVLKYHEGLIATTCCIGAEVPQAILNEGEAKGEEVFKWWLDLFGDDYYIELQRHGMAEQDKVNHVLMGFAQKYGVKMLATNDSHYVDQDDFNAHDILLCINTGEKQSTPVWKGSDDDEKKPKGTRFGFFNDQFYFKKTAEMAELFKDVPQTLETTLAIADKVNTPQLSRDILLPNFPLPAPFTNGDDYLKHITFEGAKLRYNGLPLNHPTTEGLSIPTDVEERLNFELNTIRTMGFAGYFLIVSDFIKAGRQLNVMVGPGRGSAAGSAVAFCIGITNIDPIKYSLLFERFLNPERVSMPDIDIDFDDTGRQKVIDYVIDKYGKAQVAQIVTYGTMAAKLAIRDVARTMDLPLNESDMLAKLVPDKPGTKFDMVLKMSEAELRDIGYQADDIANCMKLREILKKEGEQGKVIKEAMRLEGSIRNTGIHAAGVIIAPSDVTEFIPVALGKDSEMLVSQFDKDLIESAGMLKMDFLGLKTLTIIKDAIKIIKTRHNVDIDIDTIPFDDPKTFELYQRGDTVATFQFESEGMRGHLINLKPNNIEDLIAMNALYRPGPMNFIPNFISRKQGKEVVEYPHELLEPILKNTYGIMVYQEQIMQTAQILAGYSLGGADLLRRAMGKKDKEKMAKERVKFVEGAEKLHGVPKEKASEVFDVMEKFAEYGFNRSHAAAYSVVAYQTGYLKANYPAEFMAAVLSNNLSNTDKIAFFIDECRRLGVKVLGPSVNESELDFTVNKTGNIRFGMAAIKGVGEGAVQGIIEERNVAGTYIGFFEFLERVMSRSVNKKTLEGLAYAGAFDEFTDYHRKQYFDTGDGSSLIEKGIKFAQAMQKTTSNGASGILGLFDDQPVAVARPKIPKTEPWSDLEKLRFEKEVVSFYLSGHPLQPFRFDIEHFCTFTLDKFNPTDLVPYRNRELKIAGIVTRAEIRTQKNGNQFISFAIEDFYGKAELAFFKQDFLRYAPLLKKDAMIFLSGKYQQRYNDAEQYEFRPMDVMMLSEVRSQMIKGIEVQIAVEQLDEEDVERFYNLITSNPGRTSFKLVLTYSQEIALPVTISKFKVEPSNELFDELKKHYILTFSK